MATFPRDILDRLNETKEIEIETTRKSGEKQRTIVWVVVDGEDVFIRSEFGDRGWWYRHVRARPEAIVYRRKGDRTPIPVRAVDANDPDSIDRCSAAIRRKYRPGGSVNVMTTDPALHSTLRLEPA